VCVCVYVSVYTRTSASVLMYVCIYMNICMFIRARMCMHARVNIYVCLCSCADLYPHASDCVWLQDNAMETIATLEKGGHRFQSVSHRLLSHCIYTLITP
jgi:hypothetical protein